MYVKGTENKGILQMCRPAKCVNRFAKVFRSLSQGCDRHFLGRLFHPVGDTWLSHCRPSREILFLAFQPRHRLTRLIGQSLQGARVLRKKIRGWVGHLPSMESARLTRQTALL